MPFGPQHLRKLADDLEAEEAAAQAELADAETSEERAAIRAELAELREANEELRKQIAAGAAPAADPPASDDAAGEDGGEDEDDAPKPKMRRGRKNGNVYTGEDGLGYVYQGEDEDDMVPVEDEQAA